MYLRIFNKFFRLTITTLICNVFVVSCANSDFDSLSSLERREIPIVQANAEVDPSKIGDVSVEPVLPSQSVNSKDSGEDSLAIQRFELLQGNFNNSAREACKYTADASIKSSRLSFEAQGGYVITQIQELTVVQDFRSSFPLPGPGEKIIVLQCNSLSRFDISGVIWEGPLMIFLLVDDLGQNRVRWEPDLTAIKRVS